MEIVNIFIAIIVAFGFWRKSSKEQKRKTEKATLTKTVLLFLLTVGVTLFYYKTYQVARFKNHIYIEGVKGNFKSIYGGEDWTKEDSALYIDNRDFIPYDRVMEISLINRFTNNPLPPENEMGEIFKDKKQSGIRVSFDIASREQKPAIFFNPDDSLTYHQAGLNLDYMYQVVCATNEIPSIFPFRRNMEFESEEKYNNYIWKGGVQKREDIDDDLNTLLYSVCAHLEDSLLHSKNETVECYTENINTLNLLSAADLSQCEYEIRVFSLLPVDSLSLYFDIPVIISGLDIKKDDISSKKIKLDITDRARHPWGEYIEFHASMPTLSNMQLIRSLVLTTILTALCSLFLTNLFYYCRKLYLKHIRKGPLTYATKKRFLLVLIPSGRAVAWVLILFVSYLLWLVYNGDIIQVSDFMADYLVYFLMIGLAVFGILVYIFLNMMFKRGRYIRDIRFSIRKKKKDSKKT